VIIGAIYHISMSAPLLHADTPPSQTSQYSPKPRPMMLGFRRYSAEQGLSQNSGWCFLQDTKGFLWIGTQNGLNRFHGYIFDVFKKEASAIQSTITHSTSPENISSRTPTELSKTGINRIAPIGFNWISAIYQDKAGRLWFGGDDHLALYAPQSVQIPMNIPNITQHHFVNYRPNSQKDFSGGVIKAMCDDAQGALWVGTSRGLNIFHVSDSTFFILRSQENNTISIHPQYVGSERTAKVPFSGLRGSYVTALCRDSIGTMWVGTNQGIFAYGKQDDTFTEIFAIRATALHENSTDETVHPNASSLQEHQYECQTLLCSDDGTVWIGTRRNVIAYHPETKQIRRYTPISALPATLQKDNPIQKIIARNHFIWCVYAYGVVRIDTTTGTYDVFLADDTHRRLTTHTSTSSLLDAQGNFWLGTYSGLYLWDITNDRVHTHSMPRTATDGESSSKIQYHIMEPCFHSASESEALADSFIISLYEDRSGTVWVGTNVGGVCAYQPHRGLWGLLRHSPTETQKLSYPSVRSFLDMGDDTIWIGTDNGLDIYHALSGMVRKRTTAKDFGVVLPGSFNVWTMARNKDYALLGLSGAVVIHHRPTKKNTTLYAQPHRQDALTDGRVTAMLTGKSMYEGSIWVATGNFTVRDAANGAQGGLNLINPTTRSVRRYWNPTLLSGNTSSVTLEDYIIRSLCHDNERPGGLWVGTMNGLYRFHPAMHPSTSSLYRANQNDPLSLRSGNINCIFTDSKNRLWVGTPLGLHRMLPMEKGFEHIGTEQGMPDEWIYSIQEDDEGNLWMSTNAGLVCYSPTAKTFRHFRAGSGLQSNEYNTGAGGKILSGSQAGSLMFGGVNGVNIFRPYDVLASITPITPIVCCILINQTEYGISPGTTHITLPHDKNFIKVEFSSFQYNTLKSTRYQYRMDGIDSDWQSVAEGEAPSAIYTALPPGDYILRARAEQIDGAWSPTHAELHITIQSPWWRTQWAIFLYGCVLVGIMIGSYRYALWRVTRERELRRHAVEIRTLEIQRQNEQLELQKIQLEDQNTELNRVLEESQRTNEMLQQLNHEKNEIMGIVAHDLKNPLSGIRLTAENILLRAERIHDEKVIQLAQRIADATDRMVSIVSRLLNINQMESGLLVIQPSLCDIHEMILTTLYQYEERAKHKNIQIFSSIPPVNLRITSDREALLQIIDNLLSNALKFTPSGKNIYVRIEVRPTDLPHKQHIILSIQDEGPGISIEDQTHLFEKFKRLSAQPTGGESSTGLGLSIIKRFADLIGAQILCESIIGMGTTFSIVLPQNITDRFTDQS
jgi:signal transduction histidine kinase/sugar lactone lactonase YvrE